MPHMVRSGLASLVKGGFHGPGAATLLPTGFLQDIGSVQAFPQLRKDPHKNSTS
jgi:hypothetical protein